MTPGPRQPGVVLRGLIMGAEEKLGWMFLGALILFVVG